MNLRILPILAVLVLAFALSVTGSMVNDTHPAAWTGKLFADQPDVTVYGDYETVVAHLKDLDPAFNLTINNTAVDSASSYFSTVTAGAIICGDYDKHFATADSHDAQGLNNRLKQLAGYWELAARKCFRLGCVNTSGLFWCNDNDNSVRVAGVQIADILQQVLSNCCLYSVQVYEHSPQSGMAWFDNPSLVNGIVSYANCNDPTDFTPGGYIYPGPNDECVSYP
ncbi:hypothetical protein GQ53DRAFT_831065 [Thozetella sp. PMI_491]|nr:hypothetical protein GQ53DRAFT_831065 [Thozetella sp. PMI_491]